MGLKRKRFLISCLFYVLDAAYRHRSSGSRFFSIRVNTCAKIPCSFSVGVQSWVLVRHFFELSEQENWNFCLIVRIGCLYFYCRYTYGNIYLFCVQHAIKKIGQLCIALFTPLITAIGNGLTFYYQKATFFKLETVKVDFHPLFDGCLGLRPLMIEGLSFSNCLNNTITVVFCL